MADVHQENATSRWVSISSRAFTRVVHKTAYDLGRQTQPGADGEQLGPGTVVPAEVAVGAVWYFHALRQ